MKVLVNSILIQPVCQIIDSDESSLSGSFFVALRVPAREGKELVLDLLVSEKTYLPF